MGNILLLVRNIGPAEANLYENLRTPQRDVFVYDVSGLFIRGGTNPPVWMRSYELRSSLMAHHLVNRWLEDLDIDHVVASGIEACGFAAANLDRAFVPILWPADLDFSSAKVNLTRDFERLLRVTDRLLLPDDYEMDKALAKGSERAHLRVPLPAIPSGEFLGTHETPRVALIHQTGEGPAAVEFAAALSEATAVEIVALDINALFRSRDMIQSLELRATMTQRLRAFTHVVVTGAGGHHATLLHALQHQASRVIVEPRISTAVVAQELGFPHFARGMAIAELLPSVVSEQAPASLSPQEDHTDYLETLLAKMAQPVEPGFEELAVASQEGPVNVFFSAAALEDRSDGARPMRIRNMAEALPHETPTLRVPGSPLAVRRRHQTLERLMSEGRVPGIFYGENSTSPMGQGVAPELTALISSFTSRGGRSSWFVRDFHWLEDLDGYLDEERLVQIRRDGLDELERLEAVTDLLVAPSDTSAQHFNTLLENAGLSRRQWFALPPAVNPHSAVAPVEPPGPKDDITVLYVGGTGSIYAMDGYLDALQHLPERFKIDFIVRPPEKEQLSEDLSERGLLTGDRTRLLSTTLERYWPRTKHCIGTVLLDSEYGRLSFPYKTVSMLERGFPTLCYEDMGIAEFVTSHDIGIACGRSSEQIVAGITRLADEWVGGIRTAQQHETWGVRVRSLLRELTDDPFGG